MKTEQWGRGGRTLVGTTISNGNHRADDAGKKGAVKFYSMMQQIGDEMQDTHMPSVNHRTVLKVWASWIYAWEAIRPALWSTNPELQHSELLFHLPKAAIKCSNRPLNLVFSALISRCWPKSLAWRTSHPDHTSFLSERPYLWAGISIDLLRWPSTSDPSASWIP